MESISSNRELDLLVGASKGYAGSNGAVFSDLTLSMEEGTCMAIMGPNACGKSTLLRCLLGLAPLDRGELGLALGEQDFLGVVMQDYRSQLLLSSSVRTNLLLPLGGGRMPSQSPTPRNHDHGRSVLGRMMQQLRRRLSAGWHEAGPADSILRSAMQTFAQLGYEIDLDTRLRKLSGGAQQAVALARALAFSPRFFIWDEPTSAIDLSRRRSLYQLLERRWRNTGATVLFVTHDLDEALMLSDRVLVFDTGMKLLLDLPFERPFGEDGWSFLDSPQAQTLRSRVRHAMDQGRMRRLETER